MSYYLYNIICGFVLSVQYVNYLIVFVGICLFFGYTVLYFQKYHFDKENHLLKMKIDLLEKNYASAVLMYQEKTRLLHDEKHHLRLIGELLTEGDIKQADHYISQLMGRLECSGHRSWTGNRIVDLVLNIKNETSEKVGIRMEYGVEPLQGMYMDEGDICILFSNMFDNAIEANCKITDAKERWIRFRCLRQGQMLIISMENACRQEFYVEEGKILTTKEKKHLHGFGMKSMRKVVEKYDGHMDFQIDHELFSIVLYLNVFVKNGVLSAD